MELDENYLELSLIKSSIYLLYSEKTLFVSYGLINKINEAKIFHNYHSGYGSGGGPIFNLSNQKVIGIHVGASEKMLYNTGTFLKYPINEFINLHKDYISTNGIFLEKDMNKINKSSNDIKKIKISDKILEKSNKELKKRLILEREKNKKLLKK